MRRSVILIICIFTVFLSGCILSKTPNTNNVTIKLGVQKTFSVKVFPSNAAYAWTLDGVPIANADKSYVYTAEAGNHILTVKAKHICGTDTVTWNIYGNSPPVAAVEASATKLIPAGSVICVVRSGILKHTFPVALLSRDMCINQDLVAFRPRTDAVISKFLFYVLKTRSSSIIEKGIKPGVTVQSFYNGFFRDYPIPIRPLTTQQDIVAEIEAEQALVAANRELIARFEKKIQTTLARVWGEHEPVPVES